MASTSSSSNAWRAIPAGYVPPTYPAVIALQAFEDGDVDAINAQLKLVAEYHPSGTREFAFDAATAVAATYCQHEVHALALPTGLSLANRKEAANAHAGLCGVSLAPVIAGLRFADIAETATRRNIPVSYAVLRNRACFDASRELNGFGAGVQIQRKDCFTQACRALFPGNSSVEEWVEIASARSYWTDPQQEIFDTEWRPYICIRSQICWRAMRSSSGGRGLTSTMDPPLELDFVVLRYELFPFSSCVVARMLVTVLSDSWETLPCVRPTVL